MEGVRSQHSSAQHPWLKCQSLDLSDAQRRSDDSATMRAIYVLNNYVYLLFFLNVTVYRIHFSNPQSQFLTILNLITTDICYASNHANKHKQAKGPSQINFHPFQQEFTKLGGKKRNFYPMSGPR